MVYDESKPPTEPLITSGMAFLILFACLFAVFGSAIVIYYYYVVCPGWPEFHIKRAKHMRNAKNWILFRDHVKHRRGINVDLERNQPSTRTVFDDPGDSDDILARLDNRRVVIRKERTNPGTFCPINAQSAYTRINNEDGQQQGESNRIASANLTSTGNFPGVDQREITMPEVPAPVADVMAPIKKGKKGKKEKKEKKGKKGKNKKGAAVIPTITVTETPPHTELQVGVYTEDMLARIEQRAALINRVPLAPGDPVRPVEQRAMMKLG